VAKISDFAATLRIPTSVWTVEGSALQSPKSACWRKLLGQIISANLMFIVEKAKEKRQKKKNI
jgi:hypothetical protein